MILRMFTDFGVPNLSDLGGSIKLVLVIGLMILTLKDLKDEFFCTKMRFLDLKPIRWAIYVGLICMVLLFGNLDGGQFIYVSF